MRVCCDEEALPRAFVTSRKQERKVAAGRQKSFALMISSEGRWQILEKASVFANSSLVS